MKTLIIILIHVLEDQISRTSETNGTLIAVAMSNNVQICLKSAAELVMHSSLNAYTEVPPHVLCIRSVNYFVLFCE